MKIHLQTVEPLACKADVLILPVFQDTTTKLSGHLLEADRLCGGMLTSLIQDEEFTGKSGQTLTAPGLGKLRTKKIVLVGIGNKKSWDADAARRVAARLIKIADKAHAQSVATIIPGVATGATELRLIAQAFTEGTLLSAYRFHLYHGILRKQEENGKKYIERVIICEPDARRARAVQEGIEMGTILAEATCYTRDLVNTPSSHMTPERLMREAKALTRQGIRLTVLDRQAMERRNMEATLAVARGSEHPPFGVHLSYRPKRAKKRIAIIGKAVTFDSGGLSIKPADAMMTMKIDMAGAATVLGVFKALASLKLPLEVHGIFLAVENMPSGSAYRPGDVVRTMDGTTIEVLNTDAEGRLTLADALCYARTLKPDAMVDLATLTGACIIALGEEVAAVFSTEKKLAMRLLDAAKESGEPLWEMPLFSPYMDLIKSKIADLKNIGGRPAGAITAALFLKPFAGDIPWAHLDIAGPSYTERETRPDLPYGGSGYGVRLMVNFLRNL